MHASESADPSRPSPARVRFVCGACGSVLEAALQQAGHHGRCPSCGSTNEIPAVDDATGLARRLQARTLPDGAPAPIHAYAAAGSEAPRISTTEDGSQDILCRRCGAHSPIDSDICPACGLPFTMEGANLAVSPQRSGKTTGALVLALLAVVLVLATPYAVILAFAAMILSWLSLQQVSSSGRASGDSGIARAALVLAVIATAMAALRLWLR